MNDMWQLCPKCAGQGTVSKPSYIAGDVYEWSSTSGIHICDVCQGKKIISTITGLPPQWDVSEVKDITAKNDHHLPITGSVTITPFKYPYTTGVIQSDWTDLKSYFYKRGNDHAEKKVPIYKGCPNVGLGSCFCPGTCKEIIGYMDK